MLPQSSSPLHVEERTAHPAPIPSSFWHNNELAATSVLQIPSRDALQQWSHISLGWSSKQVFVVSSGYMVACKFCPGFLVKERLLRSHSVRHGICLSLYLLLD